MTLFEFYKKFDTAQKCNDYLIKVRWTNGVLCPHCGHGKHYVVNAISRRGYASKTELPDTEFKCANKTCLKKFNVCTGTIFHHSKVPLWQFFFLIFSSVTNKKNVSSYQQAINLGISQKSCWYIMSRIRMLCFQDDKLKLEDEVEVDETYVSAFKQYNNHTQQIHRRHKGLIVSGRIPILGLLQRGGGKLVLKVIPNKYKPTVQRIILKHVECGSRLFTDSAPCYLNLDSYYLHETVNHREGEYVRGDVYTNSIENAWTHLKNALVGTHHGVSKIHLQRYCDEFAYRWNTKEMSALEKFNDLLKRACSGKPVSYKKIELGSRKNVGKVYEQEDFDRVPILELGGF